jgi:tRNA threonylcarbamoyl adenosine modification protein YeaZ
MILGISTSMHHYAVTLHDGAQLVWTDQFDLNDGHKISVLSMIEKALAHAQASFDALTGIVVDIGPGGTSSVRTGVSFANGLAYSLDIPVRGISSAALIGHEVMQQYGLPVAVLYKSIKGHYFCGLYHSDGNLHFEYQTLPVLADRLNARYPALVLAGHPGGVDLLADLLTAVLVTKSGIDYVDVRRMGESLPELMAGATKFPDLPVPITETDFQDS